jgi:NAD(P)-dependent dehydrogenase (short-subunit alcohol dehydrogenase family)
MQDMTGKVIVITGASRGIGEATARLFAEKGARVALLARSRGDIDRIADEIGDEALAIPCDVSDWDHVKGAVDAIAARWGRVDVLINNAGVIEPVAPLASSDPAGWAQAVDVNLKGVYHGIRAVLPAMEAAGQGTIITISSGAAHSPLEGWSHYCSSKAGAVMLTECLHREAAGKGIRAMGLSPGTVATQMQREIKASGVGPVAMMDWSDHVPPEWPALALLWMCTGDADAYLGQEIALKEEGIRRRIGLVA